MRKAFGLLAWTSLAASGLWATLPGGTTRPVSADQPATGNRGSTFSRLNPFSRSKKTTSNETSYRQAAEKYMKDAQALAMRGDPVGARKLLEKAQSFPVDWGPDERTPEMFIAQLDARTTSRSPETAIAGRSGSPLNGNRPATVGVANLDRSVSATRNANGTPRSAIQQVNNEPVFDEPADESAAPRIATKPRTDGHSPAENMANAKSLMQQARRNLANQDFEAARENAEQAATINVAYGLFDQRPEQILAEIKRLESTVDEDAPSSRNVTQAPASKFAESAFDDVEPVTARRVLDEPAEEDLAPAREKAEQAAEIEVAYSLFDERSEQLLSEIARRESNGGNIEPKAQTTAQAPKSNSRFTELPFDDVEPVTARRVLDEPAEEDFAPRSALKPRTTETSAAEKKANAKSLMQQARRDISKGDLAAAGEKAEQAAEIEVAYSPFDERSEQLLSEIARRESNGGNIEPKAQTTAQAPKSNSRFTELPAPEMFWDGKITTLLVLGSLQWAAIGLLVAIIGRRIKRLSEKFSAVLEHFNPRALSGDSGTSGRHRMAADDGASGGPH